jgi:hypothetical protein
VPTTSLPQCCLTLTVDSSSRAVSALTKLPARQVLRCSPGHLRIAAEACQHIHHHGCCGVWC